MKWMTDKIAETVPTADFTWAEIGARIRDWRTARGLTQDQLAEAADLSQPGLFRIEAGETNPQLDTLQRIAKALNHTVRELLCGCSSVEPAEFKDFFRRAMTVFVRAHPAAILVLKNGLAGAEAVLDYRPNRPLSVRRGAPDGSRIIIEPSQFASKTILGGRRKLDPFGIPEPGVSK
jgi:transcriptional regulator with XRE-family HTH domain